MAFGQVPQQLSYQGVLTDTQGNPVANGNVQLTCKLYDTASGGNLLWSETRQVTVTEGIFDTILGSGTPLSLPFDTQYWLGLSADRGGSGSGFFPLETSDKTRTLFTGASCAPFSVNIAQFNSSSAGLHAHSVYICPRCRSRMSLMQHPQSTPRSMSGCSRSCALNNGQ